MSKCYADAPALVEIKKLDFLVQITDKIPKLKEELKTPVKLYETPSIESISAAVPSGMVHGHELATTFIENAINAINRKQLNEITTIYNEVSALLNMETSDKFGNGFGKLFSAWQQKTCTAEQIEKHVKSISSDYQKIKKKFEKEYLAAKAAVDGVRANIAGAEVIMRSLVRDEVDDATYHMNEYVFNILTVIAQKQTETIKGLQKLKPILVEYNTKRASWTKTIVGK